jgi:hypothetical protein
VITIVIPICFSFTPLGHADRYLPNADHEPGAAADGVRTVDGVEAQAAC